MEIEILSLERALNYFPTVATYAIRIFSPSDKERKELVNSQLYKAIRTYEFSDKSHARERGERLFDESIAERMIRDFIDGRDGCECLMIHCNRGLNRSPGVGMGFNYLFELGQDLDMMQAEFPDADMEIYEIIKNTGIKIRNEKV